MCAVGGVLLEPELGLFEEKKLILPFFCLLASGCWGEEIINEVAK